MTPGDPLPCLCKHAALCFTYRINRRGSPVTPRMRDYPPALAEFPSVSPASQRGPQRGRGKQILDLSDIRPMLAEAGDGGAG